MFKFTLHAKERMAEIGVPDSLVLAAIHKPDRFLHKTGNKVECSLDLSLGFTLAAVVSKATGEVITVYPKGCDRPTARSLTKAYKVKEMLAYA